jgi:signal transduction histidine kinase
MKLKRKKKDGLSTDKKTAETKSSIELPPWKMLIVDDEPDVNEMTRFALKNFEFAGKQLQIFQAMSSREARDILAAEPLIAVALIDVVMETDDAGLQLVDFIRNELKYSLIRLIIRTGQPGMAPEVIERYDIDDYKNKTELKANKLYTTMRVALKSYRDLNALEQARQEALQARQEAIAANRAKSTFLANISHEFRTPFNSILGYAQLLKEDNRLNVGQQEDISVIQHSGNYLLRLIEDVLQLSRMEKGDIKLSLNDFF